MSYTDSKGTYLPNDIKDELKFSVNTSELKHTRAVSEGALERIKDLEAKLAEARGLIANVKADLISIQDTTLDPFTSVKLGDCIKKLKE